MEKEISGYQSSINKYTKALKDLYMDKVNEIITQEEFIELTTQMRKDKENVEKLLIEKQSKLLEFNKDNDLLNSKKKLLEKYINVTELSREMVDNLIDYIEVGERDSITKKKKIEIHWKI